jgi:uncharacterized Zn-finger protein
VNNDKARLVELTEKDLPLHCPMPEAPLWARHPRVFLDVVKEGGVARTGTNLYKGVAEGSLPARFLGRRPELIGDGLMAQPLLMVAQKSGARIDVAPPCGAGPAA